MDFVAVSLWNLYSESMAASLVTVIKGRKKENFFIGHKNNQFTIYKKEVIKYNNIK